jgi:hypothetical protein
MVKRSTLLRQSDLTRYAKGLLAAGVEEWRIDVYPDGTHSIVAAPQIKSANDANDWDQQ